MKMMMEMVYQILQVCKPFDRLPCGNDDLSECVSNVLHPLNSAFSACQILWQHIVNGELHFQAERKV